MTATDQPTPRVSDTRCPECGGPARPGWWHTVDYPDAPHPAPVDGDAVERGAQALYEHAARRVFGDDNHKPWGAIRDEQREEYRAHTRATLAAASAGEAVDREHRHACHDGNRDSECAECVGSGVDREALIEAITPRLLEIEQKAQGAALGVWALKCPRCGALPGMACYGNGEMPRAMTHPGRSVEIAPADVLWLVQEVRALAARGAAAPAEHDAQVLRDAADSWQWGGWSSDMPKGSDRTAIILGMSQGAATWLRARAERIAAGGES